MKRLLIITALLLLSACEDRPPLATPISCAADCSVKWSKAVDWLKANAKLPVTTNTDSVVATDNPAIHSQVPAIRIEKMAQNDGSTAIVMTSWCTNVFSCDPSATTLRDSFNTAVSR